MNLQGLRQRMVEVNLRALGIDGATWDAVSSQAPSAALSWVRGTPVVQVADVLLDTPEVRWGYRAAEDTVAVLFGFGCGNKLRELLEVARLPCIVYEPDPGILRAVLEAGPVDLGNVGIHCCLSELKAAGADLSKQRPRTLVVYTPGYRELFPASAQDMWDAVREMKAESGRSGEFAVSGGPCGRAA